MSYQKDINFLPEERTSQSSSNSLIIFFVLIALGALIYLGGILVPGMLLDSKKSVRASLEDKELSYKSKAYEYDQLAKKGEFLSKRLAALQKLDMNQVKRTILLAEFEKCLPQSVSIKYFAMTANQIKIDALAPSNTEVAELYINLTNSQWFKNIQLSGIGADKETSKKSFSVTFVFNEKVPADGEEAAK